MGTSPAGWIKVNVDGSFVSQTGEAGIGVVTRDSERQDSVILESDCARIVQAIKAGGDRSSLHFCLAEAKEYAQLLLVNWRVAKKMPFIFAVLN
ncbi:hypothetical protein C2845_PM10G14470 [Panicum miliaceum]|uniref:RNase H type-1 domain-containing protein n=1 Tax=Panicum miliaceum TaxID=4540 RepID=A0A3L6PJ88_PANMI|nr:hypothetical protein C2845_PM10G14470 [Panicum miliaceum]